MKKISDHKKRFWFSVLLTVAVSIGLTIWGIYGIGEYGMALFILVPFLMGFQSTILYGLNQPNTIGEYKKVSFSTAGIFLGAMFIFAFEGLICLLMATPLVFILCYLGMLVGAALIKKRPDKSLLSIIILLITIPITGFVEKQSLPNLVSVTSEIIIDATPDEVWENVVSFPQLEEPKELIFKAGISFPINAKIIGEGPGAIRYCNFNTGSFIEPITKWEKGKLLQFSVEQQPDPMTELSIWDINAPHLHDYFVSKKGQFKLTQLQNGKTKLEGTTWYTNKIKPEFYWNLWSDWIVSSIHSRVLEHIKTTTENDAH
jgi:hypothetical protein